MDQKTIGVMLEVQRLVGNSIKISCNPWVDEPMMARNLLMLSRQPDKA